MVNHFVLIPCRINILHLKDADIFRQVHRYGLNGLCIFALYCHHTLFSARMAHDLYHSIENFFGMVLHEQLVFKQQRLTLRTVGNNDLNISANFFIRRETGAPGANYSRIMN